MITLADDIRRSIESKNITHEYSGISDRVTVTQGALNGHIKEGQTLFDFIHIADGALYKVKNISKNAFGLYTENNDDYEFTSIHTGQI